jgi:hypothetical protein
MAATQQTIKMAIALTLKNWNYRITKNRIKSQESRVKTGKQPGIQIEDFFRLNS